MNAAAVTALAALALGWCGLVLVAPAAAAPGADTGDAHAASLVYQAAARICHQRIERSFTWGGVPFPVCGRCLALYVSGTVALCAAAVAAWRAPRDLARPSRPLFRWPALTVEATWLAAAATPSALLLLVEWAVVDPGTVARALAAVPLGAMVGWVCGTGLARPHAV